MAVFKTGRADEFVALLNERLTDKTFVHCLSVAEHFVSFHEAAGVTKEQAETVGLLHDLCKAMKKQELLEAAQQYGIEITPLQREKPDLLHGPVAAEQCQRELNIDDPEVIDAIRYHTTGRPDWRRVGLGLYVADFSEPLRPRPEAAEARRILVARGFAAALRYVVRAKVEYIGGKFELDPESRAFRDWALDVWQG